MSSKKKRSSSSQSDIADKKASGDNSLTRVKELELQLHSAKRQLRLYASDMEKTKGLLKKHEDLLASVFDTADVGLALIDTKGKIIQANNGFAKLLGKPAGDLKGQSWFKLIAAVSLPAVKLAHTKTLEGHFTSIENKAIRNDGQIIDLFTTNKLLKISGGSDIIIKTIRDVTDTKKYKDLLGQTERLASVGGFEFLAENQKVTWTEEMYHIHEVGKDFTPTITNIMQFYTRESAADVKNSIEESVKKGGKFDIVVQMITGKQNLKWIRLSAYPVRAKGKTIKVIGALQDITEMMNTRNDLEQTKGLIETVFHTADIGISIVDPEGKIIKINDGLSKMLGYNRNELEGKSWYILAASASDRKLAAAMNQEILKGEYVGAERIIRHKDGSLSPVYATSKLLINPNGSKYIVKTIRDISETKKYRDLLQQAEQLAKVGGFEIDADGRHVTWTDEMYNIFEVDKNFVPTLEWIYSTYPKKERAETVNRIQIALKSGKKFDVIKQIIIAPGKTKWVHVNGIPVKSKEKGFKLIGTIQDITSQKLAEDEIVRLSYVASHTNNPVIITDARGRVEWTNKSFETLTGYRLDELKGKIPGHILQGAGTDKTAVKRISERLLKQQASTGEILLNYTKEGNPVWISTDITPIFKDGELINFVGIMTDLTDLMRARDIQKKQEVLLQKQELFNAVSKYFPNGIIGIIDQDLKYLYVGGTELKNLDLDHHNMIGDKVFDKIHPELNEFAEPFLLQALQGERVSFEVTISGKNYLAVAVPIKEMNEPITQALVVIYNITRQKHTEEKLMRAVEQQRELSELKSKFVSIASHEFRTPLSTILSSSFLLEKYNSPADETRRIKHLARIKNSVNNLTDILTDFLTLGKIEEGGLKNRPTTFNLREFFTDVMADVQATLKPGQQMRFNHKGDTEEVTLDKKHLHNILLNLLSNAIKYSPDNSMIYLNSGTKNGNLEVSVRDHGIGIPAEDQKHLFNTFYRAQNVTNIPGTGMGLHIVKKYLDVMSGTISFKSEADKGSVFTIRLPKTEAVKSAEV